MRLILEAGNCRNDIGWALDAVDAAARVGAWGFKVQLYRPETLTTRTAATYGKGLGEPATQWENFTGALAYDDWESVVDRCVARGIQFLATPFDFDAVDWLVAHDIDWFKVASADITYLQLIARITETGGRILVSTGGADPTDVDRACRTITAVDVTASDRTALLACTLSYPTPPKQAHMGRIDTLRDFGTRWVGYSDHTPGPDGIATAEALGADFCEKHFTITPGVGGDHDFAITADQVWRGVARNEMIGRASLTPRRIEREALALARRSLHATRDLEAGERIRADDVAILRPADGLPPYRAADVIGETVTLPVAAGDPIRGETIA